MCGKLFAHFCGGKSVWTMNLQSKPRCQPVQGRGFCSFWSTFHVPSGLPSSVISSSGQTEYSAYTHWECVGIAVPQRLAAIVFDNRKNTVNVIGPKEVALACLRITLLEVDCLEVFAQSDVKLC